VNLYRPAPPARPAWNLSKTVLQTAVFWALFLWLLPWALSAAERALGLPQLAPQRAVGAIVFALGGALGLCSGAVMALVGRGTPLPLDTARELVLAGPYRFVRNPMATGGIAQGIGVGLWLGSPAVVLYALTGAVLWHVAVRPGEERDLLARFGEAYARYRAATPLWLPRRRG
jgi:protein-S-isoprenylcysteine O-methyltransferase Ste14